MKCFRPPAHAHAVVAACLLTAVGCEQRSSPLATTQEPIIQTPTGPTPVAQPIVARLVIDIPSLVHLGDSSISATARAQFADGSTGELPSSLCVPSWSSSSPEVAGVANGTIEVKSVGDVIIRADCDGGLRGEAGLRVRRKIVGKVLERYGNVPLADARVRVVDTSAAGATALTDQNGGFVLSVMEPDLELEASASGLDTQRQRISVGAGDVLFRLDPAELTTAWGGTFRWRAGSFGKEAVGIPPKGEFEFETHHAGWIVLSITAGCNTMGTYDDFGATVRKTPVREAEPELVKAYALNRSKWVTDSVFAFPGRYFLKVAQSNYYADDGCPWKLTLRRPN